MITLLAVISIHESLENEGLCMKGYRDTSLLQSAIDGQAWYDSELEKICHVGYSVVCGHLFNDGNKRTAYSVMKQAFIQGDIPINVEALSRVILNAASTHTRKSDFVNAVRACMVEPGTDEFLSY